MEITIGILILGGIIVSAVSIGGSAGVAFAILKAGIKANATRLDGHDNRLEKIEDKQDDISEKVTRMDTNIEHMTKSIDEIKKSICDK